MGQLRIPFESDAECEMRETRNESRGSDDAQTGGYSAIGEGTLALTGNVTGPYGLPIVRSSSDGDGANPTGLVQVANGEDNRLAADEFGRIWVRLASPPSSGASRYITGAAAEVSALIKTGAGVVYRAAMLTTAGLASDVILMIFDKAAAPVLGDAPIWRALLNTPGGGAIGEVSDGFDPEKPLATTNGIAIGVSTTLGTYTPAGAIGFFEVLFE